MSKRSRSRIGVSGGKYVGWYRTSGTSASTAKPAPCIVTETYPPEINGVSLTLSHLVKGLLALGHAVSLVRHFAAAAALLSVERICYVWAWRYPQAFRSFCDLPAVSVSGSPVAVLQKLFYCFKAIQLLVFFGWCLIFGGGSLMPVGGNMFSFTLGGALIVTGQALNVSVFYRLGVSHTFLPKSFSDRG